VSQYTEKFKDPAWHEKRHEVLKQAGFKCEYCGDLNSELHAHHGFYERWKEPWEYDNDIMWCLCKGCHDKAHHWMEKLHLLIGRTPPSELENLTSLMIEAKKESTKGLFEGAVLP